MANRSTFPLVAQLFDGDLKAAIREWRAEDLSYESIAYLIRERTGVERTARTVKRWCDEMEAA